MQILLTIRDRLKAFYGKYDFAIITAVKFLVAYISLRLIYGNIGSVALFENPFTLIILALVCSLLPYGLIATILGLFLLANVFRISPEMALVMGVLLIVVALMYFTFHPGDAAVLILTPLLFAWKIPYVVPLLVGLTGSVISIVPVSCGIVIYYMIRYVKYNGLAAAEDKIQLKEIPERLISVVEGMLANKTLLLIIAIFAVTIILVFLIRNMSFPYAGYVATVLGAVAMIIMGAVLHAGFSFGGILLSLLIAIVYNAFVYLVDYRRTERLQFEDDEYYYYVKAVPKISAETFVPRHEEGRNRAEAFVDRIFGNQQESREQEESQES